MSMDSQSLLRRVLGSVVIIWLAVLPAGCRQASDPWIDWRSRIFASVQSCGDKETCIAAALTSHKHPGIESKGFELMAGLTSDLHAGVIVLQNDILKSRLYEWFGIDDRFVGTGFSQPVGAVGYWMARVPEYLIPNYKDTMRGVLVWKLDVSQSLGKKLADVIYGPSSRDGVANVTPDAFEPYVAQIKGRLASNDLMPPVVRFAHLTEAEYSGCLGRPERRRVFASHLGTVLNLTIEEAARQSGYSFRESSNDKKLFVMVFLPFDQREITPATWREILSQAKSWTEEARPCV